MRWGVLAVAIGTGLWALHRAALYAEARGWVYYRRRRGSSGTLGNAFLEIQTMVDPSKRIVLEERRREVKEEDREGDPDSPGGAARRASR